MMARLPEPPVIAGTFSGFVVGVIVTLVLTGTIWRSGNGAAITTTPGTPVSTRPTSVPGMYDRVQKLVVRQLGLAYPDTKVPRLIDLSLDSPGYPQAAIEGYRTVTVIFRLNDHPLGRVWRLRAAEGDIFQVMKALYTSQLPIYGIRMVGIFPIKVGAKLENMRVLDVYMSFATANRISWDKLDRNRDSEARVWKLLTTKVVDPRFA